jgi:hypothetical protein
MWSTFDHVAVRCFGVLILPLRRRCCARNVARVEHRTRARLIDSERGRHSFGDMTPTAVRFSRIVRGWIFAAALGQAALPGVVGIIDASAAGSAASAAIRPHAEDHQHPRCPRVHQDDNCALCQFVSGVVASVADPAQLPSTQGRSLHVASRYAIAPAWLCDGSPSLPRAPPARA